MSKAEKVKEAGKVFDMGYSCSQAVLSAYAEDFGLDRDTALKIAGGFGGGMGATGCTCGALTGAIMAIGLKYRGAESGNSEAKMKTYAAVQKAMRLFEERNGSTLCRDLIDCDISTPEGHAAAREKGAFNVCSDLVRSAVEILNEVM